MFFEVFFHPTPSAKVEMNDSPILFWPISNLVGGFNPLKKKMIVELGSSSPNRGENNKIF